MSDIDKVLESCKTVAIVGLSPRPERDSNGVAAIHSGAWDTGSYL